MKIIRSFKRIIILFALAIIVTIALIVIKKFLYYKGIIFPSYAIFKEKVIEIDDYNSESNDANDFDDEEFVKVLRKIELKNKKLFAYTDYNKQIWESDDGYRVQDFLWCDIDRDDENELVVLAWRAGQYGTFMPFWIKYNDLSFDQHIFIYKYKNRTFKSIWKSSYIEADVKEFYFDDEYKILTLLDKTNYRARFAWLSWGLSSIKESKFDYNDKYDKTEKKLNLIAVGDNLIHKQIYEYGLKNNRNFDYLYENINKYIEKADLKVINQETIFVDNEDEYSDYPLFGVPIEIGNAIVNAGFNLITLANNHVLDKGEKGLEITKRFYKNNNIDYVGLKNQNKGNYKILNINDIKVSVFNYTYGINLMTTNKVYNSEICSLVDEKQVKRDLDEGVRKSDLSIVFVHWGDENDRNISDFQKHYAKIFLSQGIDIVIGTHPHIVQKSEILKDNNGNELLIYYSLGNFISYQKNIENLIGGFLDIDVLKTNNGIKISKCRLLPTYTYRDNSYSTVYLLDDYKKLVSSYNNNINSKYNFSLERIQSVADSLFSSFIGEELFDKLKTIKTVVENDGIEHIDTIELGHYEQDNDLSNGKEPIEWIVMAKKDGKAYLTSKYILDYIEFDKSKDKKKIINKITYKNTYMYYFIYNDFIKNSFTDKEMSFIHNGNVTLACNYRYNSIGFDYTNPRYMCATETEFAKNKRVEKNMNEYWILNRCDTSNVLDINTNREKFVMADGGMAYDGYRNEEEKTLYKSSNIYEKKGFRPFIAIEYR